MHGHGLVHRDIKPSNIIFVNGIPKLADIGLVAKADVTLSFVGTEGFLPPEGPGKPQADIYSLGKVLYEISTGRIARTSRSCPPICARCPNGSSLVEFNEIVLKACEPELARRYQSAEEMHADLVVLQAGKSLKRLRTMERRFRELTRIAALLTILADIPSTAQEAEERARSARLLALSQVLAGRFETGDLLSNFLGLMRRRSRSTRSSWSSRATRRAAATSSSPTSRGSDGASSTATDAVLLVVRRGERRLPRPGAAGRVGTHLLAPLEADGRGSASSCSRASRPAAALVGRDLAVLTPLASALAVALRGAGTTSACSRRRPSSRRSSTSPRDGILVLDGDGRGPAVEPRARRRSPAAPSTRTAAGRGSGAHRHGPTAGRRAAMRRRTQPTAPGSTPEPPR